MSQFLLFYLAKDYKREKNGFETISRDSIKAGYTHFLLNIACKLRFSLLDNFAGIASTIWPL